MPPNKIIDMKLPLTWLLSTTATIIVAATVTTINFNRQIDLVSSKMDSVLQSNAELKSQMKDRDAKYDLMQMKVFEVQRQIDTHEVRITTLERKGK